MSVFTRDDLDNYVKNAEPLLAFVSDFSTRRDTYWKVVMAEYGTELRASLNKFLLKDTFSMVTPPATGTAEIDTAVGDVFKVALDATHDGIYGNTILVADPAPYFKKCPRITYEELVLGGTDETKLAFIETNGEIAIYSDDAEFTAPADVHYMYWRILGTALAAGGTLLDIIDTDFVKLADRLAQLMLTGLEG